VSVVPRVLSTGGAAIQAPVNGAGIHSGSVFQDVFGNYSAGLAMLALSLAVTGALALQA
jgi:hypothetical protein